MKIDRFLKQFNPRFLLIRIVVNALALAVTAAITPKIYFVDKTALNWLLMALMLGILNALLKPVLQILTLQFIFVTFGLVVVLVNALILGLLSFLFPDRFAVDSFFWALVGGLVLGLLTSFLESLLGLSMPIVDDEPPELRRQIEEQARHVDWLAAASSEAETEEQVPALEPSISEQASPPGSEGQGEKDLDEPLAPDANVEGPAVAEPAAAEPSTSGPDEGPAPPDGVDAERFDAEPSDTHVMPPSEAAVSVHPEPAPEAQAEAEEDLS
jgi:putative membrane protein